MAASATPQNPICIQQPPLLLPPIVSGTNISLKLTLFWCTIATSASFAALTSLTTMKCFNTLTHPYTQPIIILVSLLSAAVHFFCFFDIRCIPALCPPTLILVDSVIDIAGSIFRVVFIFFPGEDSVEVVVFFVAVAVDVLAVTKLVNPRKDGNLVNHVVFVAMVRVARLGFSSGPVSFYNCYSSLWYLYGCLAVLLVSYRIFKRINMNQI